LKSTSKKKTVNILMVQKANIIIGNPPIDMIKEKKT
jgi:hypothetical protein